jgi:tetratricopeptide (TPR) repeat protein
LAKGRISAHELKRDPLMEQYLTTRGWVKERSRKLLTGLVVVAVIAAAVTIYWMLTSRRDRAAAEELSQAFKISDAVVANPIPATADIAFTSEDEKHRKAAEAFEKAARDYPSYYGDLARYQAGVHQLHFDAAKGEATLKDISAKDSAVAQQAKMALAEHSEAKGKLDDAVALYQQLKAKPGEVPPLLIDLNLARVYEVQGKTKEAADLYFNVAKESRTTSMGNIAVTRLTVLDPARVDQLPPPEPANPLSGLR